MAAILRAQYMIKRLLRRGQYRVISREAMLGVEVNCRCLESELVGHPMTHVIFKLAHCHTTCGCR